MRRRARARARARGMPALPEPSSHVACLCCMPCQHACVRQCPRQWPHAQPHAPPRTCSSQIWGEVECSQKHAFVGVVVVVVAASSSAPVPTTADLGRGRVQPEPGRGPEGMPANVRRVLDSLLRQGGRVPGLGRQGGRILHACMGGSCKHMHACIRTGPPRWAGPSACTGVAACMQVPRAYVHMAGSRAAPAASREQASADCAA